MSLTHDIPDFLIQPDEPQEIGYVGPTLRFACGFAHFHYVLDIIREFWWEVRLHRAAAWDQSFTKVMQSETRMRALTDELVADLAERGVAEADTRAWLEAFRRDTDQREQAAIEADDDRMGWFPLEEEC
ncbi:hypothetical protein IGS68_28775 (plasmid) [Skermanella sp. TT6]|uniref:Uncharacterized protein n=1 Tax=Skermanella cutis TaxID=2775420 RepID=A0ABX7BFI7_9PROT|nr:hypothetical protein [Skermanella sp. TT6]QQP93141.1 hypothetical protein IGS68_28775 [Skermanella sp. TT6]